ncbi:hypothetical protein MTO96_006095 [Rhipicephalus appendiculatus]|uniref:Uncharacterized protein n=1 Tax=Rhipicephalus appendiculatus TaxID=34631 RepID=A0A131YUP8_RHIAP
MAHSGGGEDATTPVEAQQPSSPVEITQQPRVTFDLATVTRRCSPEQQDSHMDEELQALGLWEEDMTEEQKVELLRVVAASKETAQREEAVRQGQFAPVKQHVPPVLTEITWDRKSPAKAGRATSPQDWWTTEGSDDDEWPTPSSAKQSRPSRRQPVALKSSVHRVYSMEHRLNFQWGKGDEMELEDARLSRLGLNAEGAAQDPTPLCNGGWKSPPALLESWASMHLALKQAQSSPGLPLRPWTECREAPPSLLSIQDSRPREFGEATRLVIPSMSAFSVPAHGKATVVVIPGSSGFGMSAHRQDMCSSGESTPEIPGYNPDDWKTVRRRRKSRRQRSVLIRSSVKLHEVMMCKRDEKGPDLCSTSAMDSSDT